MSDFKLVVDYFFSLLKSVFSMIVGNWLLSVFFLIIIFGFIISLFNAIKGSD